MTSPAPASRARPHAATGPGAARRRRDPPPHADRDRPRQARRPEPGLVADAGPQLQHRLAGGQPHRPARRQPDDDHPPRRRRRGRAGGEAALSADRRAQGPGRHAEPTVGQELALVKIRATDSNRAEILKLVELSKGRVVDVAPRVGHRRGDRTGGGGRRVRRARPDLRDQGAGPDRGGRHGRAARHRSRRRSSDDGEDVLRQ